MSRIQNVDDLHITGPEWMVKHVLTIEDCNRAEGSLIDVLAKIDRDMASDRFNEDPDWKRTVIRVRTLRQSALEHIRARREALRQDYETVWNAQALVVLQQLDPLCFQHVTDATNALLGQNLVQKAA